MKGFTRIKAAVNSLREAMRKGVSVRVAVLVYVLSLIGVLMLGVMLILNAAGVFSSGREERKKLMENDLSHIARDISDDYGAISAMCVSYAKLCAQEIEAELQREGLGVSALKETPALLEPLLNGKCQSLASALVQSRASGAVLMLDATVNPALPGAEDSRACVYLRNMEPNIVNATDPYLQLLRGPAAVARDNGISMHAQWQMELYVPAEGDFKQDLLLAAKSKAPRSHTYFWHGPFEPEGTTDRVMLCVAPLVASDGAVFGACGFEVSDALFSLSFAPDSAEHPQMFSMLVPTEDTGIALSSSFVAGGGVALKTENVPYAELSSLDGGNSGFVSFADGAGRAYAGLMRPLTLYPDDSPFVSRSWTVALLMEKGALARLTRASFAQLTFLLFLFMAAALAASLYVSRRFLKPLNNSLESIRAADAVPKKTGIREIDELLRSAAERSAKSAEREEKAETPFAGGAANEKSHYALLREFAQNIATLSAAERAVFDLYYEGYTAEEIAGKLYLSINTIKTHSKRIYTKLNVSSRKELLVYAAMLKEGNAEEAL